MRVNGRTRIRHGTVLNFDSAARRALNGGVCLCGGGGEVGSGEGKHGTR